MGGAALDAGANASGIVDFNDSVSAVTQQMHQRGVDFSRRRLPGGEGFGTGSGFGLAGDADEDEDGFGQLEMRLRRGVASIRPAELLPQALLRRYVAYARKWVFPYLSLAALEVR